MAEFVEGFQFLADYKKTVSFFGSTKFDERNEHYQEALELARLLAEDGFTVITGGGPGIMEAANRGAAEVSKDHQSVGINIELDIAQRKNPYVQRSAAFHYFFTRKVMLSASAQAYVFFPGGFGTLDEMTEMITLVQTGKIPKNVPIILFGKAYWQPFLDWVNMTMCQKYRYVEKEEVAIIQLVDTVEDAVKIIRKTSERKYG